MNNKEKIKRFNEMLSTINNRNDVVYQILLEERNKLLKQQKNSTKKSPKKYQCSK